MATFCVTLEECRQMLHGTELQVKYFETCKVFVRYVAICNDCNVRIASPAKYFLSFNRLSQPTGASLASLASSSHALPEAKFAAVSLSLRQ